MRKKSTKPEPYDPWTPWKSVDGDIYDRLGYKLGEMLTIEDADCVVNCVNKCFKDKTTKRNKNDKRTKA